MVIHILTIFPEAFTPLNISILKKAQKEGRVVIHIHNLRDWTTDKHRTTDDRPYGGGKGMIMKIEPVFKALEKLKQESPKAHTILLSPQGQTFNQPKAQKLTDYQSLIFICGHYEGVDERIRQHLMDEEISIGNYVLTGGEIPAMVLTNAVVRLLPGVLDPETIQQESFATGEDLFDYPHYTRPEEFQGWKVPEVLLSGNHGGIKEWRKEQTLKKSKAQITEQ